MLRVNLTTGSCSSESSEKYFDYIGGKGMANRILYDEVPAGTKPLDEASKVIFAAGPNCGGSAPCSSRTTMSFLSTFTKYNAIVDAHMGGDTAIMMKYAGYDAIIIEGKSPKPVYVAIKDDDVQIKDASALWGKFTMDTVAEICKAEGAGTNVVTIGPAGENLIPMANVLNNGGHSGGGGIGCILGSKNLKALAIYGTKAVYVADSKKILELNSYVINELMGSNNNHVVPTVAQSWSEYENAGTRWTGHPGLTWGAAEGGPIDTGESPPGEPTKFGYRCQKAVFDWGPMAEKYTVKMTGCATCPVRCYASLNIPAIEKKTGVKPAHANTCMANGAYAVSWMPQMMEKYQDFEEEGDGQFMAGYMACTVADDLGLWDNYGDLNCTLGYFFQNDRALLRQILPPAEFDAIPWDKRDAGDPVFLKEILEMIASNKYEISHLADGAYFVSQRYHDLLGDDYLHSAMLGLWGPIGGKRHHGNECAAQVGLLTNIIYNRDGMCHTIINITGSGLPYDLQKSIIEELFGAGALDKPAAYTPMNESKAKFAKFGVLRQVIHDSMTLCNWVWPMTFSPLKSRGYKGDLSVEAQYMAAVTGQPWTEDSLNEAAERVIQLQRAMTVEAVGSTDMRNLHDVPANYIFDSDPDIPAFSEGTTKLERADWQTALTMFYKEFGWDETTGAPTRASLEKFGLKDVADALDAKGLLPA